MSESGYNKESPRERKFDSVLKVLHHFIKNRYDDNLGIVTFGNFAFALSPLTYDRTSLNYVLKFLDVGIAGDNTAIGDGLFQSLRLLQYSTTKNKVIILLSDGYQNSGLHSPKEGVQNAKSLGIKIYTIGIGSEGNFDSSLLQQIATQSGGKFFQAKNIEDMKNIYKTIDTLEPSPIRSQHYLHKTMLFDIPLFGAIALLLLILIRRKKEMML
jgi:Ca-activated chloride channel family protein